MENAISIMLNLHKFSIRDECYVLISNQFAGLIKRELRIFPIEELTAINHTPRMEKTFSFSENFLLLFAAILLIPK